MGIRKRMQQENGENYMNEKLHNLYLSSDIISDHNNENRRAVRVARMEVIRNVYRMLSCNLKGSDRLRH